KNSLEFWEVATGRRLALTPLGPSPRSGRFSPDGSLFAISWFDHERNFALHDVASGRALWRRSWPTDLVSSYPEFSADGRTLVVYAGAPGRVEFLDTATGRTKAAAPVPSLGVAFVTNTPKLTP